MFEPLLDRLRERISSPVRRTDMTDVVPTEVRPPVTASCLAKAEGHLGFPLVTLLKSIYLEVGNGGFGPGYGLISLGGGATFNESESIVDLYKAFHQSDPEDRLWNWPDRLVPICTWGCAIYSCVDCSGLDGPVILFDPNGRGPDTGWEDAFRREFDSLQGWLTAWLDGVNLWNRMYPE
jgi:hypothetical protein